jgi:co-chaperonin GroES (HSP10)
MLKNESGLRPAGRAVLIEPYEPERRESVIVLPDEVAGRQQMVEQRATIIEIGPTAWCDEPAPRAKVGEKVFVTRFAGFQAQGPKDGKMYRFINDRDIFAIIDDEGGE